MLGLHSYRVPRNLHYMTIILFSKQYWEGLTDKQWSNPERKDLSFTLFVLRVLPVYCYCKVSISVLSFNSSTDLSTLHWDFSTGRIPNLDQARQSSWTLAIEVCILCVWLLRALYRSSTRLDYIYLLGVSALPLPGGHIEIRAIATKEKIYCNNT